MVSFSAKAKNELAHIIPEKKCCQWAELSALVRVDGVVVAGADQEAVVEIATPSAAVARKIYRLEKLLFNLKSGIAIRRNRRLRKTNTYLVTTKHRPEPAQNTGVPLDGGGSDLPAHQCCRRAYLRGAFLGGGSLNNPGGTYHLELITRDAGRSRELVLLMEHFGLHPKLTSRKRRQVIYLKESEQIVDFLNIVGAHGALLEFENVRIVKGVRNNVNRLVNCETANLNKTISAGVRQLDHIKLILDTIGLHHLPAGLQQVAELRLEFPEYSLKELGDMLSPRVSKSGVNHRLRRLEEIAQEIREHGKG